MLRWGAVAQHTQHAYVCVVRLACLGSQAGTDLAVMSDCAQLSSQVWQLLHSVPVGRLPGWHTLWHSKPPASGTSRAVHAQLPVLGYDVGFGGLGANSNPLPACAQGGCQGECTCLTAQACELHKQCHAGASILPYTHYACTCTQNSSVHRCAHCCCCAAASRVRRYTSKVTLHPPNKVSSTVADSALFHHLESTWQMTPGPSPNSTWLSFSVDFAFLNPLYANVAQLFFSEVVTRMMGAFEGRCKELYGQPSFAAPGRSQPHHVHHVPAGHHRRLQHHTQQQGHHLSHQQQAVAAVGTAPGDLSGPEEEISAQQEQQLSQRGHRR